MDYIDLDHSIVYIFLLLTIFIGLFAGKGSKTIEAYTIAHKMYGVIPLVATYLAIDIGNHFGPVGWNMYTTPYYLVGYQCAMSLFIGLIFLYKQRKRIDKLYAEQE